MSADKLAEKLNATEPSIDLPEEQWRDIETAIGIEGPDKNFRFRLAHYVQLALGRWGPPSFGEAGGPKQSVARQQLNKVSGVRAHGTN
jgi:hypothetical protein